MLTGPEGRSSMCWLNAVWEWCGGEARRGKAHLGFWPCPMNIPSACEWNHSKKPAHPIVPLSFFFSSQSWTMHFQSLIYQLRSQHNLAWYQQALVFWPQPVFLTLLFCEWSHSINRAGLPQPWETSSAGLLAANVASCCFWWFYFMCQPKPWWLTSLGECLVSLPACAFHPGMALNRAGHNHSQNQ